MAKTGSINITYSQSVANNTSTITVKGIIKTTGESYRGSHRTGTYTIKKGSTVIKSGSFTSGAPENSTTTLFTVTFTVNHNADGSYGTITASYNYDDGWCTGSGSKAIPTIPRASSISFSSANVKPNAIQKITISRASSAFTHTLTYSCNGITGTIATKTTSTSVSFTVPASLIAKSPNANQTMTITCQTYSSSTLIGSKTGTFTVGYYSPSTIGTQSGNLLGSEMKFTISRNSELFTHSMWYSFGSKAWQGIGSGLAIQVNGFTPPISLCSEIPNAIKGSMTIILRTYYGSTQVGSDRYYYYDMSVPDSVVPSFASVSYEEAVSAVSGLIGAYVQNKSKLKLTINGASGSYGSTIKSYRITVAGHTVNASSGTTGVITAKGSQTITAVVTDSRGRTATKTASVNILEYSNPRIEGIGVSRNGDKNANVTANLRASSLNVNSSEKNKLKYKIEYKGAGDTSYTSVEGENTSLSMALAKTITGLDATKSYDFRVYAGDVFGYNEAFESLRISTSKIGFDKDTKNGRLGIGKFLEYEDSRIEVPDGSYLYVGEKRISMDDISGDGLTWFIKQENGIVYLGTYDEWVSAGKPSMI